MDRISLQNENEIINENYTVPTSCNFPSKIATEKCSEHAEMFNAVTIFLTVLFLIRNKLIDSLFPRKVVQK